MSKPNKAGKTPLAAKTEASDFTHDDLNYSILDLDPELKAEIEGQGLVARWINAPKYLQGGNFHQSGWRAYKAKPVEAKGALDFSYGRSPEGYVIRHDLLLAVKPAELQARWKARIQAKARASSGKDYAKELKEKLNSAGVGASVKVHDGYEANEGEDAE